MKLAADPKNTIKTTLNESSNPQVDFANQFIGRGTLGAGRIQEEIRFCTCPELLGCLSFMESLHDNEAIVVTGFEQFSECSGYSSTLKFCGDFRDRGKVSTRCSHHPSD